MAMPRPSSPVRLIWLSEMWPSTAPTIEVIPHANSPAMPMTSAAMAMPLLPRGGGAP